MIQTKTSHSFHEKLAPYLECQKGLRLFEILVCLWTIFHAYKLLGITHLVDSPFNFCSLPQARHFFQVDVWLWQLFGVAIMKPAIVAHAAVAGFILWRGSHVISRILLWWLTLNVFSFCSSIGDGGTSLLSTLLLPYIFCDVRNWHKKRSWTYQLYCAAVLLTMQLQISIVYLQAAFSKICSEGWASGVALHYILQIPEFSNPLFTQVIQSSDWLIVLFTYATIGFQLTFAFAMTVPSLRLYWLAMGILFHIGIGLCMGLLSFALFMICVYALFLSNKQVEWLVYVCKSRLKLPKLRPFLLHERKSG